GAVDMAGRGARARQSPGLAGLFGAPAREAFKLAESPAAANLKQALKLRPDIAGKIQEKLQEGLATPAPAEGMTRLYRTERPSGEGPSGYSVHAGRLRDRGAPPGTHFTDKESAAKEWRRAFPVISTAEQRALYNAYNEDYDKYRTLYTRAVAAGDTEKAKELKKLRDEAY